MGRWWACVRSKKDMFRAPSEAWPRYMIECECNVAVIIVKAVTDHVSYDCLIMRERHISVGTVNPGRAGEVDERVRVVSLKEKEKDQHHPVSN